MQMMSAGDARRNYSPVLFCIDKKLKKAINVGAKTGQLNCHRRAA